MLGAHRSAAGRPPRAGQSVEVLLEGQNGATGNGWQPAQLQGDVWSLNYLWDAGVVDPTGSYIVRIRATDRVGNQREIASNQLIDASAPVAQLTSTSPRGITTNISQTVTIGGVITDTGVAASGVASAEVAFVPAEQVRVVGDDAAVLSLPFDEPANATRFENLADIASPGACAGASCPAATPGRAGQARSFDGVDDYMNLGNPAALNLSGQVTIAAWVKPQATKGIRNIVAHGYSTAPRGKVFLRINEGRYQVGSWNGVDHLASALIPNADLNQWVHLAGVYDGTTWRLYRNGVQIASKADSTGAVPVNLGWAIGSRGGSPERLFTGLIDEVAIYGQALSGEQVRALMRAADIAWYPVQLAQAGQGVVQTSWSAVVPADLEGTYQIDVRGTDVLGNRNLSRATWNVWRGDIDTRAPRVSIQANYQGGGATRRATYTCAAQDFNLDEASFACPGVAVSGSPAIQRTFYDSFWWRETVQDPARLYGVTATYSEPDWPGGAPRVRACDRYGHCAEAQGAAVPADTIPSIDAAIIAPPA
ncbi:MAG TPA: LamG domain-containing protein, partial [Roseiflexaceae bacterium]|nr:LamG domain-containing protein [Roseiflexaceae bacterium]